MYYYNEQECILNSETRESKPELFIPEGEEFLVDYFDITCHLKQEKCPTGQHLKAIRTINAALPEGESELHVLKASAAKGIKECVAKCFGLAPEKCRSFNYDKKTKSCDLLYLDGHNTLQPQVRQGVDLYDLHCLAGKFTSFLVGPIFLFLTLTICPFLQKLTYFEFRSLPKNL